MGQQGDMNTMKVIIHVPTAKTDSAWMRQFVLYLMSWAQENPDVKVEIEA